MDLRFKVFAGILAIPVLFFAALHRNRNQFTQEIPVTANQVLSPTGNRIQLDSRPLDVAVTSDRIAVLLPRSVDLLRYDGGSIRSYRIPAASLSGIAFSPDESMIAVSTVSADPSE